MASLADGNLTDIIFIESVMLEDDVIFNQLLSSSNYFKKYACDDEVKRKESVEAWKKLKSSKGILIPGGYGNRGFRGKIKAAQFARENKIALLGVCFGF